MPRVSQIAVPFRGGFRGRYVSIKQLIHERTRITITDFSIDHSRVHGCDTYCRMQIVIDGTPFVTWHSSQLLADYLSDCRQLELRTGQECFPITDCMITVGDDRAYYLADWQA